MVDIVKALANQVLYERFRIGARWSSFDNIYAWSHLPQTWGAILFAYEMGAPERLHSGIYTSEEDAKRSTPRLSFQHFVRLGLSIVDALEHEQNLVATGGGHQENCPLGLACAHLLWGDDAEGRRIVDKLREGGEKWVEHVKIDWQFFQPSKNVNPTSPTDFGLEPFEWDEEEFRFGSNHMSWVGPKTVERLLTKNLYMHLGYVRALGLYHNMTWGGAIERACERWARNESKARVDYPTMVNALRGASHQFFVSYMSSARGVRVALGATRADAPDHIFTKGLRKLNNQAMVDAVGPWVGRPLQLSDIKGMSPETLVRILYSLPWGLVEELVTDHNKKITPKLARLVGKLDYLEMIRNYTVDHPHRVEARNEAYLYNDNWQGKFEPIIDEYHLSRNFREKVLGQAKLSRDHLLLMVLAAGQPNLMTALLSLAEWPVMRDLIAEMPQHLVIKFKP